MPRRVIACLATALATMTTAIALTPTRAEAARTGAAPGAPGKSARYLPSDKAGFGTARGRASNVWYTLAPGGGAGELYYPDLSTPASRQLGFAVGSPDGHVVPVDSVGTHTTTLSDGGANGLTYTQTDTAASWQLVTTWRSCARVRYENGKRPGSRAAIYIR